MTEDPTLPIPFPFSCCNSPFGCCALFVAGLRTARLPENFSSPKNTLLFNVARVRHPVLGWENTSSGLGTTPVYGSFFWRAAAEDGLRGEV